MSELLDGFNAKDNLHDRRILYEVAGMRFGDDELRDAGSSSSEVSSTEGDETFSSFDYAIMYGSRDSDEESPPNKANRHTIN